MYKLILCCLFVCLSLASRPALAGDVDPCGNRNDCLGFVIVEYCDNGTRPPLGAHRYGVVLLDTANGDQFVYAAEYGHSDQRFNFYGVAAGELDPTHTFRSHFLVDEVYVGDWSEGISPPHTSTYDIDLLDCSYRLFLPLVIAL